MKMARENLNSGKTGQRSRYWSLMLVGEHGRVIPFKHFKGLAMAVVGVVALSLLALVVLGIAYVRQDAAMDNLRAELTDALQQAEKLRDEKDLLMTKLVVTKEMPDNQAQTEPAEGLKPQTASQAAPPKPHEGGSSPASKAQVQVPPAKAAAKPPSVKEGATIKNFKVSYDSTHNILKASFRVYNASKPKAPLSGRTVMVFKKQDDPPLQWLSVPRVPLVDEKPSGKRGKAFKINNYRTMDFKAYGLKLPIRYNTAVAFIFSADGDLLLSEELSFNIDYHPPKPEVKPPSATAPAKSHNGQQPTAVQAGPEAKPETGNGTQPATPPQMDKATLPTQPAKEPVTEQKPAAPDSAPGAADQTAQPDTGAADLPAPDTSIDRNGTKIPETPVKPHTQGESE